MQATMDEEPEPEPPMPNSVSITSQTTGLDVERRTPGGAGPWVELVLRLAMMEYHTWLGIGGRSGRVRRPRRLSRRMRMLALDDNDDDYRGLIGGAIKYLLSEEEEFNRLSPAHWDEAVPLGVERDLAVAVQRGAFEVIVDIDVHFEFVYSEPEALMLACVENNGGGDTDTAGRGGDGEAPSCPICFQDMSREAGGVVTDLPGCAHGFHRCCIAAWIHKASTCQVCRRDQLQYLPPDYRDLHDSMAIDPDSLLPDYL